ncbi:MAG: hypothetical protein H7A45_11200 [Verrucomicrobiales bacterium]|nr:hypothetical protein [Verrucomicrobiales bacterium]MCP5526070.1 hypothetical protein [Verrucomicrobiales bacterium]
MSETPSPNRFEEASRQKQESLIREIWGMLRDNRKYWMIPLIVVLLLFGLLIILGSTGAAPFIYTLF